MSALLPIVRVFFLSSIFSGMRVGIVASGDRCRFRFGFDGLDWMLARSPDSKQIKTEVFHFGWFLWSPHVMV